MPTRLPTPEEIQELVAFLPRLYADGMTPVKKWHGGPTEEEGVMIMPWPEYEDVVCEFFRVAARECWYDHEYLAQEPGGMLANETTVRTADLAQARTMLTYCVRLERFCTGHWAAMIECGHIRRLLERLAELGGTEVE